MSLVHLHIEDSLRTAAVSAGGRGAGVSFPVGAAGIGLVDNVIVGLVLIPAIIILISLVIVG